jgi:hypothetical protein
VFVDIVRKTLVIAIPVGEIRAYCGVFPDVAFWQDFCAHRERVYAASGAGLS